MLPWRRSRAVPKSGRAPVRASKPQKDFGMIHSTEQKSHRACSFARSQIRRHCNSNGQSTRGKGPLVRRRRSSAGARPTMHRTPSSVPFGWESARKSAPIGPRFCPEVVPPKLRPQSHPKPSAPIDPPCLGLPQATASRRILSTVEPIRSRPISLDQPVAGVDEPDHAVL